MCRKKGAELCAFYSGSRYWAEPILGDRPGSTHLREEMLSVGAPEGILKGEKLAIGDILVKYRGNAPLQCWTITICKPYLLYRIIGKVLWCSM